MKVKLVLKEPKSLVCCHKSAVHDRIVQEKSELKHKQINDTVSYCINNGCRSHEVLVTGNYPLIKDARVINSSRM